LVSYNNPLKVKGLGSLLLLKFSTYSNKNKPQYNSIEDSVKNCTHKLLVFFSDSPPQKVQIKFLGNMGEGIKSEAAKNIRKKTTRIGAPTFSQSLSDILIFNKHCCRIVKHKYAFKIRLQQTFLEDRLKNKICRTKMKKEQKSPLKSQTKFFYF